MRRYLLLLISFTILSCSPVRRYQALPEVLAWEKGYAVWTEIIKKELNKVIASPK
ncbi:MAG: hypothetical protein NTV31_09320 [Bacteroidia bacterium]|nr:hypothetical protein [Bacteroidia bacterium]